MAAGEPGLAPDTSIPQDARPFQGHRAGFVTRSLAAIIDVVTVIVLVVLGNLCVGLVRFLIEQVQGFVVPDPGWSVVIGTALVWLLWTYSWSTSGRSLGMAVMGLRIVDYNGHRVRLPIAALRAVLCIVFPIGLLWAIISPANRSCRMSCCAPAWSTTG